MAGEYVHSFLPAEKRVKRAVNCNKIMQAWTGRNTGPTMFYRWKTLSGRSFTQADITEGILTQQDSAA
jgi:hypothetical protein